MEIINLGAGDGLPPVDWAAVTEKLDAGLAPAPDADNSRTTWLTTVNEDGQPACDCGWCRLARWRVLVPDGAREPGRAATSLAIRAARLPCRSATR